MKTYLKYPARFIPDTVGFTVVFPDLPGCLTEGDSLKEAKVNAKEALCVYLDTLVDMKNDFPEPSKIEGNDIFYITGKLGTSTYTGYHKLSYEKNKEKVLSEKKQREIELKDQGYKNFREFLHKETLDKLDKVAKSYKITRRELLTNIIEKEFEKISLR